MKYQKHASSDIIPVLWNIHTALFYSEFSSPLSMSTHCWTLGNITPLTSKGYQYAYLLFFIISKIIFLSLIRLSKVVNLYPLHQLKLQFAGCCTLRILLNEKNKYGILIGQLHLLISRQSLMYGLWAQLRLFDSSQW